MRIFYTTVTIPTLCYFNHQPLTAQESKLLCEFAKVMQANSATPPDTLGDLTLVASGLDDNDMPYAEYR